MEKFAPGSRRPASATEVATARAADKAPRPDAPDDRPDVAAWDPPGTVAPPPRDTSLRGRLRRRIRESREQFIIDLMFR